MKRSEALEFIRIKMDMKYGDEYNPDLFPNEIISWIEELGMLPPPEKDFYVADPNFDINYVCSWEPE